VIKLKACRETVLRPFSSPNKEQRRAQAPKAKPISEATAVST